MRVGGGDIRHDGGIRDPAAIVAVDAVAAVDDSAVVRVVAQPASADGVEVCAYASDRSLVGIPARPCGGRAATERGQGLAVEERPAAPDSLGEAGKICGVGEEAVVGQTRQVSSSGSSAAAARRWAAVAARSSLLVRA